MKHKHLQSAGRNEQHNTDVTDIESNIKTVDKPLFVSDRAKKIRARIREGRSKSLLHCIIVFAQILYGIGSIVKSLGISTINPVLFLFILKFIATFILTILSRIIYKTSIFPSYSDLKIFFIPAILTGFSELFYIIGLKLCGAIIATTWSVFLGILALFYGYLFGVEKNIDLYKIIGICLTIIGALYIVTYSKTSSISSSSMTTNMYFGTFLLFLFVNFKVLGLIYLKKYVYGQKKYKSITKIAYIGYIDVVILFCSLMTVNSNATLYEIVCPNCTLQSQSFFSLFSSLPLVSWLSILYSIFFINVIATFLLMFANKYVEPSLSFTMTALQPFVAVLISTLLIHTDIVSDCAINSSSFCLFGPTIGDYGALGIILGLLLIRYGEKLKKIKKLERQIIALETQLIEQKAETENLIEITNKYKYEYNSFING